MNPQASSIKVVEVVGEYRGPFGKEGKQVIIFGSLHALIFLKNFLKKRLLAARLR